MLMGLIFLYLWEEVYEINIRRQEIGSAIKPTFKLGKLNEFAKLTVVKIFLSVWLQQTYFSLQIRQIEI